MGSFLRGYNLHHIILKYKKNIPSYSAIIPVLKCTMAHQSKIFKIHHSKPITYCCPTEDALFRI